MQILELIQSRLPESVRKTELETTKGLLYWPNDNLRRGPKYLIRLHFPLKAESINWDIVSPFFNGGCEEICRNFFAQCNGFSFFRNFSAFGINIDGSYDRQGFSHLNVPYDLVGQSYGSYPQFAPNAGYFISSINLGEDDREICDIITPEGNIIYGEFRKNTEVLGAFDSFESWIGTRVPQALADMAEDLERPVPTYTKPAGT